MNEKEKLIRDIDTLRESIRLDWQEIGTKSLTDEEKQGIRQHIGWCQNELDNLLKRLDSIG